MTKYLKSFDYQYKTFCDTPLQYGLTVKQEFLRFLHYTKETERTLKNKTVLDVGCGSGRLTKYLQGKCKRVLGVDANKPFYLRKGEYLKCDIENIPLKKQFDIVWCAGVIHHTKRPRQAFYECARLAKEKFFSLTYSKENWFMKYRREKRTYLLGLDTLFKLSYQIAYRNADQGMMEFKGTKRKFNIHQYAMQIFDTLSASKIHIIDKSKILKWYKEKGFNKLVVFNAVGNKVLGVKR